jgi:hypothetical protein
MLIIEYFGDEQKKLHVLWSCMKECITFLKHIYQPIFVHFHKYEKFVHYIVATFNLISIISTLKLWKILFIRKASAS